MRNTKFKIILASIFTFVIMLSFSGMSDISSIPAGQSAASHQSISLKLAKGSVNTALLSVQNNSGTTKANFTENQNINPEQNQAVPVMIKDQTKAQPKYANNQILVSFKKGVSTQDAKNAVSGVAEPQSKVRSSKVNVVNISDTLTVDQAIENLKQNPNIASVQPNYVYTLMDEASETQTPQITPLPESTGVPQSTPTQQTIQTASPNVQISPESVTPHDPLLGSQWYLSSIDAYDAWGVSETSKTIKVADLDTGVDINHPDLKNNIDPLSYDVIANGPLTGDLSGHGTHVAGIIAAEANNNTGIAGVSYNADIIAINVFQNSGGNVIAYTSDILTGYQLAVKDGARVINMSLGGYGAGDSGDVALESAIDSAAQQGVVTVCAGGNGDSNNNPITDPIFPGDYNTCISVVPLDSNNTRPSWADYNQYKDISAPGINILSTLPQTQGSYGYESGSSMSTPMISGVVALMLAKNPGLTVNDVKNILYSTATDLGTPGRDDYYGYGKVNAYKAVTSAAAKDTSPPTGGPAYTSAGNSPTMSSSITWR